VGLALLPQREGLVGLASGCAAIILAVELAMDHWFYLYIPWFFWLVLVALLGRLSPRSPPAPGVALEAARATPRAVAISA
jgi:hypothetical protein